MSYLQQNPGHNPPQEPLSGSRTIPLLGAHPDGGDARLWRCELVWRAVGQEIEVSVSSPLGTLTRRDSAAFGALFEIRIHDLAPRGWALATKAARWDVWHLGIHDDFPGVRAEILTPGLPPEQLETVDIFEIEGEPKMFGSVSDQLSHYEQYINEWKARQARGEWQ